MADSDEKEPTSAQAPAVDKNLEIIARIRERADLAGKSMSAIGASALTAIGIAKVGDLFSFPNNVGGWLGMAAVLLGFLLIASVAAFLTRRIWAVGDPIIMRSHMKLDDAFEEEIVSARYSELAALNGARSMRALEARAHRFQRIASHVGEADATALRKEVDEIQNGIHATFARVALMLSRNRASHAISGRGAKSAVGLFILGIILFAGGSDFLENQRADAIALAKSCAEASKAGAADLPPLCGAAEEEGEDEEDGATPRQELVKSINQQGDSLEACESAAKTAAERTPCSILRSALNKSLEGLKDLGL